MQLSIVDKFYKEDRNPNMNSCKYNVELKMDEIFKIMRKLEITINDEYILNNPGQNKETLDNIESLVKKYYEEENEEFKNFYKNGQFKSAKTSSFSSTSKSKTDKSASESKKNQEKQEKIKDMITCEIDMFVIKISGKSLSKFIMEMDKERRLISTQGFNVFIDYLFLEF